MLENKEIIRRVLLSCRFFLFYSRSSSSMKSFAFFQRPPTPQFRFFFSYILILFNSSHPLKLFFIILCDVCLACYLDTVIYKHFKSVPKSIAQFCLISTKSGNFKFLLIDLLMRPSFGKCQDELMVFSYRAK